jgi:imidazolonepropionase-like amidohydrolase
VEQAKRQLEDALKTVLAARAAGVTLALGYDSGPPGASANELLRLAEAGLSPMDALRTATIGGAAALGRTDLGRIAVGAPADLVVVNGRPDEDLAVLTRPASFTLVRKAGQPVSLG